ncbi:MAG: hypothetical protein WC758_03355 [Candidatus Woesearchaeota archaeon]|jgi:hypothetical protein
MVEKLNIWQKYDYLKGSALDIVPKALENGGSFTRIVESMKNRSLAMKLKDEDAIAAWVEQGYWTLNPIFYDTNGNVKFGDVFDKTVMDYVRQISPAFSDNLDDNLDEGRMVLSDDFNLESISGVQFNRKDISKYANKFQIEKQANKNNMWLALADNDKSTLEEHNSLLYKLAKDKYGKTELMAVFIDEPSEKNNMGLFWFGRLGNYSINSNAIGNGNLYDNGRVVRVNAPEAQVDFKLKINVVSPTLQDILAIEKKDELSKNQRIKLIRDLYAL